MISHARARKYPTKAEILRTVQAARESGIVVNSIECSRDGTIRLSRGDESNRPGNGADEFEAWDAAGRL